MYGIFHCAFQFKPKCVLCIFKPIVVPIPLSGSRLREAGSQELLEEIHKVRDDLDAGKCQLLDSGE